MIRKIKWEIQKGWRQVYLDVEDYRQSILLAGTGRSGTTWVQECINSNNSYRVMFEPFHPLKIPLLKDWSMGQYIPEHNLEEKFLIPTKTILSGDIRHPWIDNYNRKHFVRKRLIKEIRAHLFLKWIKVNFPEIPIIFLLRHPCAVANSMRQLGWDNLINHFLMQPQLMKDFLNPFKQEIENAKDEFDRYILSWCITNYVPLRQFHENEMLIVFYESMCVSPQKAWKRILSYIGDRWSPGISESFSKPSALCRENSPIITGSNILNSWRESVSTEQITRAVGILRTFGLHHLYGPDDMPLLPEEDVLKILPS